jgi:hypothetical protein
MTDIDITAKSDRELLIMVVDKLNSIERLAYRHNKWIEGNGLPGARFQLWVLWTAFLGLVAFVIK